MSANLNFNQQSGQYAMFSAKEVPWHGLGQIVEGALTSEEAIIQANLDYYVSKGILYVKYPERLHDKLGKKGTRHEGQFITYREDTGETFGVVGSKYEVIQNKDAFAFFDDVVGFKEAIFETAGALGKGEVIFITAKLPNHIKVDGEDVVDRYLLFTNSHDGSKSVEVLFTPIRVVCNNTLQMALSRAKNTYKIRHTKSAHDRLAEAKNILKIENTLAEEATEIFKAMTRTRLSDRQSFGFINKLFLTNSEIEKLEEGLPYEEVISTRKKNILADVQAYLVKGPGQDLVTAKGTVWGVYNAITGYYNNVKNYTSDNNRMQAVMFGNGATTSEEAYRRAVALVKDPSLVELYN